jgi:DNA-binding IclR family transcriptional regulator
VSYVGTLTLMQVEIRSDWQFLTNHAQVLVCIAGDPDLRLRDIGARIGVTERAVHRIVTELSDGGYLTVERNGRRNCYAINSSLSLPDAVASDRTLSDVLSILVDARHSESDAPA